MNRLLVAIALILAPFVSKAQAVGSLEWLMKSYDNMLQSAGHSDVFYCDNGSMIVIPKLGGMCTYCEKGHSWAFQIYNTTVNNRSVYKAKYSGALLYPVNSNNINNATALIATREGSNVRLTYKRIPENQQQAYRRNCRTTNSDFSKIAAATAETEYAINSGISNGGSYNNAGANNAGSNNNNSSGVYKSTCSLCGGDGLSPQCNYTSHYGYGASKVYCEKCRTTKDRHSHPTCPGCNGKGYTMRPK